MGETADTTAHTVTVLFFSVLREETGRAEQSVTLPAPVQGADLLDALATQYPVLEDYRSSIRLAVNQEYVSHDARLREGDEVALITPVSGG